MTGPIYPDANPSCSNAYLWPALKRAADARSWPDPRAFDLGCGNGATCKMLTSLGFDATGIDPSETGIAIARTNGVNAHIGNSYDDLAAIYGTFPLVVSLEVIEHCDRPRAFTRTFCRLVTSRAGGMGFLSTPYHGYLREPRAGGLPADGSAFHRFVGRRPHQILFHPARYSNCSPEPAPAISILRIGRVPAFASG